MSWKDVLKSHQDKKEKRQEKKKLEVKLRQLMRNSTKWDNKQKMLIGHAEELHAMYGDRLNYAHDELFTTSYLKNEPYLPVGKKDKWGMARSKFSNIRQLNQQDNPYEKEIREVKNNLSDLV